MSSEKNTKKGKPDSLLNSHINELSLTTRRGFLAAGVAASAAFYMPDGIIAETKPSDNSNKSTGNFTNNMKSLLKNVDVYFPGDENYSLFLKSLFSAEAAHNKPSAIVCPKKHEDIMQFIKIAAENTLRFTVCGGGLSSLSVQTDMLCLALNVHYNKVAVVKINGGVFVKVQGGSKAGDILAHLKTYGYHIPVGVSPLPGLGLIMRGGIGYLSRSEGLTCDYISQVNFITARGDNFLLDAHCIQKELWNAVRGAAPRFGIVSEVYLSVVPGTKVALSRLVADTGALKNWLEYSDKLQEGISASLVLGSDSAQYMSPVLYGCLVHQGSDEKAVAELSLVQKSITGDVKSTLLEDAHRVDYTEIPAFDVPLRDSGEFGDDAIPIVKSYLIKNSIIKNMSAVLLDALRTAPNQFCRIDLQHIGGKVRRIKNGSVFCGRDADWSIVVTGFYYMHSSPTEAAQAIAWVKNIMDQIKTAVISVYSVEIKNNTPETKDELEMAFQDKLKFLHRLSKKHDPLNLLSSYPL
ncbi:FAD-dependent oxidoreductase [Candidatus Methylospira mobilis]|uniref:FAD-binding oxidoreductase n=1 Tax=Candidatus Methylospira mobilis TaxID=1808979 RepID=UPI0028F02C6F|nr:FAD-dependent oxidoreductase [Candidatus Methylospira mobilis]WNV03812.1 FAD-dependent oxidoreductase [Candidatus Methylospira mobilis]